MPSYSKEPAFYAGICNVAATSMASKICERIYVEAFLACLEGSYRIIKERESPDFLVEGCGEPFGLEVVQIFRDQATLRRDGSPAKTAESLRDKGLRRLAEKYYEAGGLPLDVKALFSDPATIRRRDLVERLKKARPSVPWERIRVNEDGLTLYLRALPPERGNYCRWLCIDNSIGWRGQIGQSDVLPVIKNKAARLTTYRSVVQRIELLIVVDCTYGSGMVHWDASQDLPSRHGFDAIYLYFHPEKLLWVG